MLKFTKCAISVNGRDETAQATPQTGSNREGQTTEFRKASSKSAVRTRVSSNDCHTLFGILVSGTLCAGLGIPRREPNDSVKVRFPLACPLL